MKAGVPRTIPSAVSCGTTADCTGGEVCSPTNMCVPGGCTGDPDCAGPGCADFQFTTRLHRRQLLQLGGRTGMGRWLPDLFRARAAGRPAGEPDDCGQQQWFIGVQLKSGAATDIVDWRDYHANAFAR